MFLLFEKNYTKEYEKKWRESSYSYDHIEKMLTLLSEYTHTDFVDYFDSLSRSHKESVKSIIQPYLNKTGELKNNIRYKVSVRTLFAKICTKIPEKELHPKERLFAIFKVVKNHTYEDIFAIYQNQNKGRLELVDASISNKMVILMLSARESDHPTLFSYLPNDVALYICQLMLLHTERLENNSAYHLLLGLLEGYCGFNRSIPAHFERAYAEQISVLLAEHQVYPKNLFGTVSGLLFKVFQIILPNEINPNDGLHHIFNILYEKTGTNALDFTKDSPLIRFFIQKKDLIDTNYNYKCWIKMLIGNRYSSDSVIQDINSLFAYPWLSQGGKQGMLESLIEGSKDFIKDDLRAICKLIASCENEIVYSFTVALKHKQSFVALYLICHVNQFELPSKDYGSYCSSGRELCHDVLWELTWFHTKKESHFKLLVELLNFAATHPTPKYLHQGRTVTIYQKLVDSHALIPNFKAVEKTFIDCFIPNINDFFHYLLDSDSYRVLAKHLLESKIPGLNLLDKQLNLTFNSFYGYTIINNKKSINEKLLDEEGMTFFQIVILDSVKTMRFDSKLLALANALIAYNEACVFQVDSQGKSVVDYLNSIQVDNLDKNYQDSYRDLCKLIKNKFYPFPQVGAFFCGRTKDTSNNSIVSQLPDELLCKIASLTLNLKPGK